jgi:hypothetical protein
MTAFDAVYRTTVHPLFRVFVTLSVWRPRGGTASPLTAARGLPARCVTSGVAHRVWRGRFRRRGDLLGTGLFQSAFSAHSSAVPRRSRCRDATLLPLVPTSARRERPFTWKEVGSGRASAPSARHHDHPGSYFMIGLVCRVASRRRRTTSRMAASAGHRRGRDARCHGAEQVTRIPDVRPADHLSSEKSHATRRLNRLRSRTSGWGCLRVPACRARPARLAPADRRFGLDYFMLTTKTDFRRIGPARGGVLALTAF